MSLGSKPRDANAQCLEEKKRGEVSRAIGLFEAEENDQEQDSRDPGVYGARTRPNDFALVRLGA